MSFNPPPRGDANQIAFTPDLKWVAMAPDEFATQTDIRHVSNCKIAVSLYLFADEVAVKNGKLPVAAPHYWLALTPDNFYNGSPNVEKWLRWRKNGVLLPVGALKNTLRQPQKVRAALR